MSTDLLKGLNENQKEAVAHKDGPILVVAGAGTGKTTVITRRIAYLIAKKLALPSEILALTFTEKAAEEMEARVDLLVPYGFVDTQISTFHAFGDRILRDFALDLGLPANFKVLSKTEQAIFFRENIYAFDLKHFRPIANPLTHIDELLKHFSRLKDELISPSDYIAWTKSQISKIKSRNKDEGIEVEKQMELANAYERYQDLMLQNGSLDYGDQIFLTYKLLKENPNILKEIQNRYKFILVDEFQDTNFAQYEVVKLIAGDRKNIMVVGDDDQSVYRFRGASISNILSFKDDYPNFKQIVLNENYRSTRQILDASYKLIQHNNPDRLEVKNRINKKLTTKKVGSALEMLYCDTLSCEADKVAAKILELKKERKFENKDFAILARANSHLEPFIEALNIKKIPNVFVGTSSLFDRPEIKMLVSFFKCLASDNDNLSFYHLARSEIYNINENILTKYYTLARRENKSFSEIFEVAGDEKIANLINDIENYRENISKNSAGEILYEFLKEKKYFKKLSSKLDTEAEIKIFNIAKFFDRIKQFDRTSSDKSVLAFLSNLELILTVGDTVQSFDIDPDLNAVNVMTAHASKGLEWPVVFVVNLVSQRFPSNDRRERIPIPDELVKERLPSGDFHLQEERRLFYVASTRAKEYLFLTAAEDYGGKRSKKMSQFVLEMLDEPNVAKLKHKMSPIEKIELHRPAQTSNLKSKISEIKTGKTLRLSRQQIDDYFTCPKKYYYASIVKIPLPQNWHFMYGTAIHEAIGRYFTRKINGEKPTLESMIDDFNQSFTSEGFITREHEEERKRLGIETLNRFFAKDQTDNLIPHKVEDSFEFNEKGVRINGRYDLVVMNGEKPEICDFKTSTITDQKEADRRIKESTQMMIYALAWYEKYKIIPKTTLLFIESDLRGSLEFSKVALEKTKEMIFEVAEGVRKADFAAKPNKRQCSLCPYKDICPESAA